MIMSNLVRDILQERVRLRLETFRGVLYQLLLVFPQLVIEFCAMCYYKKLKA